MKVCPTCDAGFDSPGWTCPSCGWSAPPGEFPVLSPAAPRADASESLSEYRRLAELEPLSFWFRSRNRLATWALERFFPHATRIFEAGCGSGFVLGGIRDSLAGVELVGGDSFPPALEIARRRLPGVELLQCDARALPYADHFDVVVLFDLLEHVREDLAVVKEVFRAARRGGGALVAVPQHPWLWSGADEFGLHVRRYGRGEIERLLRVGGFEIEFSTSFVSLPLPGMVLSRLRSSSLDAYDAARDLYPGRPVNAILERLLELELGVIERGASLPLGGSRFVVVRKP